MRAIPEEYAGLALEWPCPEQGGRERRSRPPRRRDRSIIVTDSDEESLQGSVLPSAADTRTLVLSDVTVCKTAGTNDTVNYPAGLPHASGGALPPQQPPSPQKICEGAPAGTALDEDGNPRGDYLAGEVPNIQRGGSSGPVNEGQVVLTNGMNVGHRDGSPSAPGPLAPGAFTLDVSAGQGLRFQMVNAATTRFFRLIDPRARLRHRDALRSPVGVQGQGRSGRKAGRFARAGRGDRPRHQFAPALRSPGERSYPQPVAAAPQSPALRSELKSAFAEASAGQAIIGR